MAQGAVMLMLFAFMMCLSCLSSSAVGSGVFYACSDGTMSPGDFDINKCTNFGFNDILQGTGAVTGTSTTVDTSPATSVVTDGGLLVPGSAEDEDPNATFLDFFGTGKTETLTGLGVVAAATSKTDCAKICYNNEVQMRGEGEECNGFVSDGFSKCVLYPTNVTNSGSSLQSGEKSYGLKNSRSGMAFNIFTTKGFETGYADKGDLSKYGNLHDIECEEGNEKGALTSFRWQNSGQRVRNLYSCMMGDFGPPQSEQQTTQGSSGGFDKLTVDGVGLVDCGNQFIHRWKLKQWGTQANIAFNCTRDETSDSSRCVDLETNRYSGTGASTTDLSNMNVQCPNNTALTQFNWVDGKIVYRCCPKPTSSAATRSVSRANSVNVTNVTDDTATERVVTGCKRLSGRYSSDEGCFKGWNTKAGPAPHCPAPYCQLTYE